MNFYRFFYRGGSTITFACKPRDALPMAASFARWTKRELLRIKEIKPLSNVLELA